MNEYTIILVFIGVVAYTIKAMQPDGFLNWIPSKIKLGCFPCIAGWLAILLTYSYGLMQLFFDWLPYLNPLTFLFIGASGYALYKFME